MGQGDKASGKHWYHHTACHFLELKHTHLSLTVSGTTMPLDTAAVAEWFRAPSSVQNFALPEQWEGSLHR